MYLQIVGKVRLTLSPMEPQWGQVPLYVTARGLNTSPIPHPAGVFDIDIDLIDHVVSVRTASGSVEQNSARAAQRRRLLRRAHGRARCRRSPRDDHRAAFRGAECDPVPGRRRARELRARVRKPLLAALVSVDAVMKEHRAQFRGKVSPVQFY